MARGHRQLEEGDAWQALLAFEEAARAEPRSVDPPYYMGVAYVRLGKYEAAQEQFQRALALNPHHKPSAYGMALAKRAIVAVKD